MGVGKSIQRFGRFLDEIDGSVGTVAGAELVERHGSDAGLVAELELLTRIDDEDGLVSAEPTLDSDGHLRLSLTSATPVEKSSEFELEPERAVVDPDGTVRTTFRVFAVGRETPTGVDGSEERAAGSTSTSDDAGPGAGRVDDVPPFRDPELLATVYESCETFAEMSEAIEMDVTAETVRRYMIDYGIHEPASYDVDAEGCGEQSPPAASDSGTATPESTEERETGESSPVALADGIGLPDDVTVDGLVETVSGSTTVYEVKRDLGLSRDETLELLRQLDLVEFVVGRVADERKRRISRDEVVDRLRRASSADAR